MTTLPAYVKSLQRRIDDLDDRLRDPRFNDRERHDLKVERRTLVRSLLHYYRYLLKGAA